MGLEQQQQLEQQQGELGEQQAQWLGQWREQEGWREQAWREQGNREPWTFLHSRDRERDPSGDSFPLNNRSHTFRLWLMIVENYLYQLIHNSFCYLNSNVEVDKAIFRK